MKAMSLNKGMPVNMGLVRAMLYGGPFRQYVPGTRRLVGVKMAAEIDHPHEVSVPTQDFSVPEVEDMVHGIIMALQSMLNGKDVYVGCMGGIGRTGLFMGCMAKVMIDFAKATKDTSQSTPSDPVMYVRGHYMSHAIETNEQQDFVRNFPTEKIIKWYLDYTFTKPTVIEKVVLQRPTLKEFLLQKLGFL